ncbi:protein Jumonji-like [Liolophura sinensis]|uniref:protein Jumonji-like n=1 Tax=Liolophura sinensis TaxID=3198878 RepID=UPI0031595B7D
MTNKRKNSSQSTAWHSKGKKEEDVQAKRPKRLIVTKNVDESTGLSWREETDLKRALYASLQESKRLSRGQEEEEGVSPSTKLMTHHHHQHHGRVTRGLMGAPVRKPSTVGRFNQDESSQESGTSSSTHESKKTTVHAQRKFAQGHSQPSTPSTTPVKVHSTPVKLFSKRAKTEDFLTFLCLRGSSVLPPHLDFFGYSRDEHQAGESSRPNTPGHGVRSDSGETRESTPDLSSSSDSDMRDEVPELANLIMKNQHTPTRKAARASASTPETARGLASIRPSVAKKANKVPAKDLLRRSKVFLTKPNKMSPRSERALLRHQRSPSKSGSGKKSGSDFKPSDAVSSKPVRASATPSKKRITPQSLPIGSMPKFYIDDSDSSVQSRDSKDTTTSRRGKLSIIPKPPQPVKQKSKIIKGKDQPKQEIPIKPTVKPAKKLSSVKKVRDKKNVASKTKTKETGPSGRKVTRLKEKGATNVRKKRRATLSKNYAEDVDDDLDSVDDLEVLKHSKKTSLMKKGRDKRSESRRKIVAASLAKMAASKKLSNIKRKKQQSKKAKAEVNMDASSAIARKARQAKAAKVRESIESQQSRHSNVKSSASSPRRRGRPRSLSSTPSKEKADTPTHFPAPEDGGHIVEVPTFYPSAKEFLDPHQYIASIRCQAEPYGMCRVVPPASWKPECKVNDELRFTSQLQYIHKMQNRWSVSRKHLASINVELISLLWYVSFLHIGGIEVDLPKLLHTMQVFGGAQNVGDKKTWIKVADAMKIPKLVSSLSSTPSKEKADTPTNFPAPEDGGHIVEVPTFYPSAKEFLDPHQYIASIRCQAEPYGMCRVVPPASWKPECKVNDELRFTSQLQYIHKMQNRWGPNVQQMECIRKHLASINVELDQPPLIGGIEVDLPKLLQTMQVFGGAQNVGDKKTWIKVADAMKIPKLAQDRATKLYDAYCKYLLSYDTLSYEEKTKLEHQVWMERQKKLKTQKMVDDSVVKGRSTSLGDFNRVARNTVSMWFKEEPFVEQVECEYWKLVQEGQGHVVVQCGHVDTRLQGSAFPVRRDSPCSRHGWNFNVLPQNPKSLLKSMGPVTGVTIPTLHIGMLFTTSCWSTDLHLLPYIQYLHTGADTVWYSVPQSEEEKFKSALTTIVPDLVTDNDTWLSEDTVMVSPDALSQKGVSLGRCVQKPGQFMVVFSNCHTATVSCGYSISESVHFAYADWIPIGVEASKRLNQMGEPELFSVEGFLCNLIKESSSLDILGVALPQLKSIIDCETGKAQQLIEDGLKITKQMAVVKESVSPAGSGKRKTLESVGRDDCVCDICKKVCHLFMVVSDPDESVFCLDHAAPFVQRKKNFKGCRLLYRYTEEELAAIVKSAEDKLEEAVEREAPEKPSSGPRRRSVSLRSAANSGSS